MNITFTKAGPLSGRIIAGTGEDMAHCEAINTLNEKTGQLITNAIKNRDFSGKSGQCCCVHLPPSSDASFLNLVGFGDQNKLTEQKVTELGASLVAFLKTKEGSDITICFNNLHVPGMTEAQTVAQVAYGLLLKSWSFEKYRAAKPDAPKWPSNITVITEDVTAAEAAFMTLKAVAEGIFLTRDLITEPCNIIYPETFVERAKELKSLGVKIDVLDEKDMQKLGMGALLGVGQGSEKESRLLVLQWNNGPKDQAPIAIVGKGVTFDTGGISIKPAGNMDEMKTDMSGAAVVVGLMKALAGRNAKVNVVGVAGLVENMPSGSALRPGDVVTTMSGKTIEILNTDAEGRLVLADALWYTQDRFKPQAMVNLATLTGAIVIALGHEQAGIFSNNDALSEKLIKSATAVDELLWRMPLSDTYDRDIDSDIADMKNLGAPGGAASSTAAAQLLQRFVNDVPWAHLDIAGVAWTKKDRPLAARGASGFGVRLLENWIRTEFE
jgi:leucyl aminopeptidase